MKKKISLREPHRGRKRVGNARFTKKKKKEQFVGMLPITGASHRSQLALPLATMATKLLDKPLLLSQDALCMQASKLYAAPLRHE